MSADSTKLFKAPATRPRIALLDAARGVALLAMAAYHFVWDLEMFGHLAPGTATSGFFKLSARTIATSFLFLAGFSLVLAASGGLQRGPFLKRLAMVGGAAAIISAATFLATPDAWIRFGILHHIAMLSIVGLAFIRLPVVLIVSLAAIALWLPRSGLIATESTALAFLGFDATPPPSSDFVPMLPWLAAGLAGIAAARLTLARGWDARLGAFPLQGGAPARLAWLGRHSLVFYLVHQPVLIGLIWAAGLLA
jgi:uncharacterized membrane protein